jgi:TolB-like protein/DNA-binding winged helix-turn-helix (wHTH) protein/tetratricopeptide (TPR) repeat protein
VGRRQLLLKADGRALPLSSKALETLVVFVQRRGELLDKDTLMKAVWPHVVVEENNLNQSISALRRVLGDSRDEPRFIVTVPGRGYRFVADVRVVSSTEATSALSRSTFRGGRIVWAGGVVAAVVIAVLVWLVASQPWNRERRGTVDVGPAPAAKARESGPRLAILPFANLSPDAGDAFFAEGLHEEILSTLSGRMPGVAVISRTTMLTYRDKEKPLGEVARELSATHVMEGTVRREGERVRLTLQLVDAGTDRYLWSQTYDRTLSSAMSLQSEVAAEVATQLSVRLADDGARAGPITRDAEAYDLYLQALLAFRSLNRLSGSGEYQALAQTLDRALARDPGFALAHAQRARLNTLLFISSIDSSERNRRSIRADLEAARRLAPNDPVVLAAFGYFLLADGEIARALEVIQSAEAAGLHDPEWLIPKTRALLSLGRVDEVIRVHERMLSLDPANPLILGFTMIHLLMSQRPEAAARVAKLGAPEFPALAGYWDGYIRLAARGDVDAWSKSMGSSSPLENPAAVTLRFQLLRYERRYVDLVRLLEQVPMSSLRCTGEDSQTFDAVGERPIAEYRGWAYMLLGNRLRATEQGRAVLAFVAEQPETERNRFFLRLLAAQGHTFTGEKEAALKAARSSLELMPRTRNAVAYVGVALVGARVFSWNGMHDEAVQLLEELAVSAPGLQPGLIVRDPLYTVPLADSERFRSLAARLEREMVR